LLAERIVRLDNQYVGVFVRQVWWFPWQRPCKLAPPRTFDATPFQVATRNLHNIWKWKEKHVFGAAGQLSKA
jgi:hypothetical protein